MNEKKPGISPFLFIGLGFLIFVAVAGYFLITFLNDTVFSKPEINILQPTSPQVIPLGDGYLLVTYAKSDQGLHRVEFYMDQVLINQQIPPSDSAQEMLAQFAWLPQAIGAYDLSFIAYDMQNKPSERASIPIAVIAPNLPEQVTQQIRQEFSSLPLQNTAGSNDESDRQDGSNDDRQDEEENDIWHIENFELGDGVVIVLDGDQNQPPNTPPFIDIFDVTRDDNNTVVNVYVAAVDDTGLFSIMVKVFRYGEQDVIDAFPVKYLPTSCDGMLTCDLSGQFSLSDGAYSITAEAEDINANPSAIWIENVQVVANHEVPEPPVLIVENQQFNIPVDILLDGFIDENNRIQLPQQIGGFGNVDPFEEIDPQVECPPFCPAASLDDVDITVEQFWRRNGFLSVRVTLTVPPGFSADNMEGPYIGAFEVESHQRVCTIGLSDEVLQNGATVIGESDIGNYCGGREVNYAPRFYGDFLLQAEGNRTTIQTLSCPPPKPELIQLHATTNCGGAEKCIIVSWNNLPESPDDSYPADHFAFRMKYFNVNILEIQEDEFDIPLDQTSFIDTEVFNSQVYEYSIESVSADGVRSGFSRMNIKTPRIEEPWDAVSTDWQHTR